jgi:hypothetical protein
LAAFDPRLDARAAFNCSLLLEAELMRVLQFAKRPVMTVALVSLALVGCGGGSDPDAPFNPSGTSADLQAMNSTFASPTFASFSTFSVAFDAALGGSPIISSSVAALDVRGKTGNQVRAAAVRSAKRLTAMLRRGADASLESGRVAYAAIPAEVAGKTFVYDLTSGSYVMSDAAGAPANGVRFMLYAVDPVSFAPIDPLVETGYVDLIDLSAGTTQSARVVVVSSGVTYVDYTVTATSGTSTGKVTVVGMVTDGTNQANIGFQSTINFTAGLTLSYALDLPQRDVSIDLNVNVTDVSVPDSPTNVSLTMRGPNGTVAMSGQFTETSGTLSIRVSGHAFATINTSGSTTTITRIDGTPLSDDEMGALQGVFEIQSSAFVSFDEMMAPVGAFFE